MRFACIIPLYNHAKTVLTVAQGAKKHISDVRIVDDGSTDLPENFEEELKNSGIKLIRHEVNAGKGAALKTAAKLLAEEKIDYMIVLDADGQHDPDDIPKFTDAVEQNRASVVIGCRDFNTENVPGSSRFGRKFSNFWCYVETGKYCDDTQSGFRAYPVEAFNALKLYCDRYNFEIEVLVKLIRAGFTPVDIPIKVTYEPRGKRISHFHPWKDNFRLSLLHTALVARRLLPIPYKRLAPETNLSAKRGNRLGIGFFRVLLALGGFRIALFCAWIVTWFYAVFDKKAFSAAEGYLRLRFPAERKLKKHFHRLIYELAKILILSARQGSGKELPVEERGTEFLPEDGESAVPLLAHFGCWQMSMSLLGKPGREACIMARPDYNQNMDKFLALKDPQKKFRVISTESFSGGLVEAAAALEQGTSVIVMGDRAVSGTASAKVPYFGGTIELPLSPWMLAARCRKKVIPVFAELAEKPYRIILHYCKGIDFQDMDADHRIRQSDLLPAMEEYGKLLQEMAERCPYQVFRFGNEQK